MESFGSLDLGAGGVVGVGGGGGWVWWYVERCTRSDDGVGCGGEDETEMAMLASALVGWDKCCVSLEAPFEGTEGCVIRRPSMGRTASGKAVRMASTLGTLVDVIGAKWTETVSLRGIAGRDFGATVGVGGYSGVEGEGCGNTTGR